MQRMTVGLAVLITLGLGAAPTAAQTLGRSEAARPRAAWRAVESEHFRVCFPGGLDSVALRVLDLAEQTEVSLARRLGRAPSRRVSIVVYGAGSGPASRGGTPGWAGEGAGGFVGRFAAPVVVTFTGSYGELRHDVVCALARVFISDQLGDGSIARRLARRSFFAVPPWFTEGLAEYLSSGAVPGAGTFVRDGIVEGTLPSLASSRGAVAGELGCSAIGYLVDRHGEERLGELLRRMRRSPGFEGVFRRVVGIPVRTFEDQWREWLRREAWPAVATRRVPERFAQRLTGHRPDGGGWNTSPAVSPQGDRVAWFSDRRRTTDLWLMPVAGGRAPHRIRRGGRGERFETMPASRNSIAWSPDGLRLALTTGSGGRAALLVVSAADGRVVKRIVLDCDALCDPAWSPVAESLVVAGVMDGRSDLWLVDARTGITRRLTADAWDEREPCWAPDGRTVTFVSDRLLPVMLRPEWGPADFGRHGLFDLDLASGSITRRTGTAGDDHSPAWSPDGSKLAFVSDHDGASDLVICDIRSPGFTRLATVSGGVSSLSWSRQDDRLVFSAFHRGGCDVFAVRAPVSVDAVLARARRGTPQWAVGGTVPRPPRPGSGGPAAASDSALAPAACRARLSPDAVEGRVLAGTGLGLVGSVALSFGEIAGERRVTLAGDVYGAPLARTNAVLLYRCPSRGWILTAGLFRLESDPFARVTGTEEALASPLLSSERVCGAQVGASRPFGRYHRLDLALSQGLVGRALLERGAGEDAAVAGRGSGSVSAPSLSLVGDETQWGSTGPVNGGRSRLAFCPSFEWRSRAFSCRTLTLDVRRYWALPRGYTIAARTLAALSEGRDARTFLAGGFPTLRGFAYDGLRGTRLTIANAELRFPFIERLGAVGGVPLGSPDLRGALFADAGMVWQRGEALRFTHVALGHRRLASPLASFGAGVRARLGFMIVRLDAAWRTDLASAGRPQWEVSTGPEF